MTRYFYTDPLAAAWMAKHFGMVFRENPPVDEGWVDPLSDVRDCYIVCPDSLPLLETQAGDLVFYGYGVLHHIGEAWDEVRAVIHPNDERYPTLGDGQPVMLLDSGEWRSIQRLNRIIQRAGMAFMWPEVEP